MTICPTCRTQHPDSVRICPQDGTVLTPAIADPRVGQTLDGKYRLDAVLGRGGMGSIYRATHLMLDKPVAVKLINADLAPTPDMVRRFQREARAAGNLNHPNIAAAFDLGQTSDGTLYIAMELVGGQSLKDAIRTGGPMAPDRIVRVLTQVASALAAAHARGIIHRDLKPQNIMLAPAPGGGETAKLLDFGIAKTFDESATQLTTTGLVLGTPQYMSPEQAAGRPIDGRSDLYSLGIILFEMLVGDVPFNDPSTPAVLVKHLTQPAPPPSTRRPDLAIPPALEAVALRCLEKEPEARFQDAAELAAALEQASQAPAGAAAAAAEPTVIVAPQSDTPTQRTAPIRTPTVRQGAVRASAPATAAAQEVIPPAPTVPSPVAAPMPPAPVPSRGPRSGARGLVGVFALLVVLLLLAYGLSAGWFAGLVTGDRAEPIQASSPLAPTPEAAAIGVDAGAATSSPASEQAALQGSGSAPPAAASGQLPPAPAAAAPQLTPPAPPPAGGGTTAASAPPVSGTRGAPGGSAGPKPSGAMTASKPPAGDAATGAATQTANPAVAFRCAGETPICASLRAAMGPALKAQSVVSVSDPQRADILVDAQAEFTGERREQMFGTTLVTRTYAIELAAQTLQRSETVPMPAPTTVSYDARVGQEKLNGEMRVLAGAVAEKIRAFWQGR